MRCPFCRTDNDKVIDSRASQDGFSIRRRRECLGCKRRYTTYERVEEMSIKIIKKDNVREPFQPEKIKKGLALACWKRPISESQIESIVSGVESDIYAECEGEVESHYIGELVMRHLQKIDQVAYVRFASVYREFKDVHDFVDELQPMLNTPRNPNTPQ
ncbi:transcriptional regulator NrdR [Blastopirellula sp. JC732]|uniref:Transcriptional repressor NrdR n=1 Tax=Blastopirellula sediminis TaxID=2894196 RepID=A0A9X1MKE7_9BACT|nr:transcriptional regulator NrdR [Blastopirellula sediminis]MCC9608792.1 transcriptional regulator NrdR [Blastopirellula sediminis]MCC9628431.1 transcriptional regulator NrdR [Blastopirellula sediminis]